MGIQEKIHFIIKKHREIKSIEITKGTFGDGCPFSMELSMERI